MPLPRGGPGWLIGRRRADQASSRICAKTLSRTVVLVWSVISREVRPSPAWMLREGRVALFPACQTDNSYETARGRYAMEGAEWTTGTPHHHAARR